MTETRLELVCRSARVAALTFAIGAAAFYFLVIEVRWRDARLSSEVTSHFLGLDHVEFCTVFPNRWEEKVADSEWDWVEDQGFGFVDAYRVMDVRDVTDVGELLDVLGDSNGPASCFWPRHAIRDPYDADNYLLVCFECSQIAWSLDGKKGVVRVSSGGDAWNRFAADKGMEMPPPAQQHLGPIAPPPPPSP